MKVFTRSLDSGLLDFWYTHAAPGRIGLIGIDVITARLIGWAERRVTANHQPSPWAHVFLFLRPRHGIPWIAESDLQVPLPGYRPKPNGPQVNPVYKWAHPAVTQAAVLDPGLSPSELTAVEKRIAHFLKGGYTYSLAELAETFVSLERQDPAFRGRLHRDDAVHCAHFVRECLQQAGRDPLPTDLLPENTVPEHYAQVFPIIAEWRRSPTPE